MLSLIARVIAAANAPCSFVGCTRHRHVGPCNVVESHAHVALRPVAPVAVVAPPVSQVMPIGARAAA